MVKVKTKQQQKTTKNTVNLLVQAVSNITSIFVLGAKFRKYNGHSAHVTNVRFSIDGMNLISTGGADHSIFQWQVIPEGYKEEAEEMASVVGGTHVESNDEASDSDLSDVNPLDSDVEEVCNQGSFMRNVFNSFLVILSILYPLKTPEHQSFSCIFRRDKMGTLFRNGCNLKFMENILCLRSIIG